MLVRCSSCSVAGIEDFNMWELKCRHHTSPPVIPPSPHCPVRKSPCSARQYVVGAMQLIMFCLFESGFSVCEPTTRSPHSAIALSSCYPTQQPTRLAALSCSCSRLCHADKCIRRRCVMAVGLCRHVLAGWHLAGTIAPPCTALRPV